jgi:hypothetical protein
MALVVSAKSLKIKYGESHHFRELLNVHESPTPWISVGSKRYDNVMGASPPYLEIPGRNAILFITADSSQSNYIYHFVSLEDGNETVIGTRDDSLHLFLNRKTEIKFESVESDRIVVYSTTLPGFDTKWRRYVFDLTKKTAKETWGK